MGMAGGAARHKGPRWQTGVIPRAAGPTLAYDWEEKRCPTCSSGTMFDEDPHGATAEKVPDWVEMDRPHKQGYISDPKSTAKSLVVTAPAPKESAPGTCTNCGRDLVPVASPGAVPPPKPSTVPKLPPLFEPTTANNDPGKIKTWHHPC
jgi:hypothetical protein